MMELSWPREVKKLLLRETTRINPCANFLVAMTPSGGGAASLVLEWIWVARLG